MTTQFEIDCALMAGASYISTRSDVNRFPVPQGWAEKTELRAKNDSSGFEAATLTVTGGKGGLLTIDHFKNDDLGIHLGDQPPGAGGGRRSPRGVAPQAPDAPPDSGNTANRRDPLLVDLGAGIQTVGLEANLHFDGDANGLKERTGWAAVGTGLLMLDRDNDGQLTDGSELFGDATPVNGGIAVNGFLALAQYDRNRDGRIDAADPVWNQLKVWTHATDPITGNPILNDPDYGGELRTLDELGIRAIHLNATTDQVTDAQGNTRLRSASLELADGSTREIAEYRLARNGADTVAIERLALDADLRLMPELPGMGSVNDLRQVMQRDTSGTLKNLVAAFAAEADATARQAIFDQLLYRWAGVDTVATDSRGPNWDGRKVAALEHFYGMTLPNPSFADAVTWDRTWRRLAEDYYAGLMAQTRFVSRSRPDSGAESQTVWQLAA